ncbi:myb-like protein A isoform X2 [Uranotaenia lowii]|uniref:myb-like protein A isoform X2 n=1 Tax=Uranotaenia lowii TaxID=190385 RepID=UPI00247AC528|nr:myb-like protein A isoform X2 [Uranotaenia lowii]
MNSRIKEDVSRLFEYWCEIAPGHPASANGSSPSSPPGGGGGGGGVGENRTSASPDCGGYIVHSFPESFKEAKVIADIPSFAFPCNFERKTIQVHSFVLTNIDSKWRFGFCRHDPKSPTAMVIVTYLPWHDTFIRFLNVLADVRKNSQSEFESFLSEAYNKGIPEPGGCLKFQYDRPVQTFSFQRPQQFLLPSIPENHNLNLYYNFVDPKFMIGIFAAMLAERRIIFVSQQLDRLSSCIQAANAFLYPMVWQHIFIPVLPSKMRDILGAPMPFLIGVPEPVYASLRREEVGEVVILNCDKRTLETPFDDVKNMPPELVASLKKHLSNQTDHRGDRVSKIFLGILVQLIGGYRDAVKFNDKITFDPETFIDTRPSHLRPFLTKMLQLQIFQQFIEERLDMLNTGQGFSDEFELECSRYAEKSGRKVKQYKDLLKNFKDKVKEGGKGVKTAYKGLRSKFRETTPPKSKMDSSMHSHVSQYDIGHQSAPNSPVFNKRPQTIALPSDSYSNHAQMLTPSSTSLFNSPHIMMAGAGHNNYNTITGCSSSNYNGTTNTSSSHNNNNHHHHGSSYNTSSSDVRSPSLSLSPTSSNSSSEMNILQELQQFDLFKSPAVNRNLKPAFSVDSPNRSSSRTGAPVSPPGGIHTLPRIQEAPSSSSAAAVQQPLLELDLNPTSGRKSHENNYNNNDDNFDLSPDMPCPPVPPRRFQTAAEALAAIQISPPPMSPPSSSSSTSASPYRNYNNFFHQAAIMQQAKSSPPSTTTTTTTPPAPPPLKAARNDPLLTQFDDDELITLTPNNSATQPGNQISSSDSSSQIAPPEHPSVTTLVPTTTTAAATIQRRPSLGGGGQSNHSNHHNNHHKPPAPQPPQRPPLAPKPTFRKESANVDVADATHSNATNSKPSKQHCKSAGDDDEPPDDSSQDLINLDTTNNSSSFELEDFDPLNDNAKPIPIAAPRSTLTALTPGTPPAVLGFNNPIYPYFTPPHLHSKLATSSPLSSSLNNGGGGTLKHFSTTALQPPHHQLQHHHHQHSLSLGGGMFRPTEGATAIGRPQPSYSGSGATGHNSCAQDDFELLRNYGLDKFSLLDSASVGKTNQQQQQQHHMSSLFAAAGSSAAAIAAAKKQQQQQQQQIGDRSTGFVNSPLNGHGSNSNSNNYNNGASKQFTNWTTFD